MDKTVSIQVQNHKELRKAARTAGKDAQKALRDAHKETAGLIARGARPPRLSDRLANSIKPRGTQKSALVSFGGARAPHAGPIHFGNPTKKGRLGVITPQPFIYESMSSHWRKVMAAFEDNIREVASQIDTSR